MSLLDKTRKLNKILQKSGTEPVVFDDICNLLSEVLQCNVYIISRKGKILGFNFAAGFECDTVKDQVVKNMRFPDEYNNRLLSIDETRANLSSKGICVFEDLKECAIEGKLSTIVPINGNRERLGTLLLARFNKEFTEEDLVLAEYSATIVGMEILRAKVKKLKRKQEKKASYSTISNWKLYLIQS